LKKLIKGKGWRVLLGLGVALILDGLTLFQPIFLASLDHKIYDALLHSSPRAKPSPRVGIVDLDEASLAKFGQWPWPRYRVALLLEKIKRLGAAAVGLDMVFAEPDRLSPEVMKKELQQDLYVVVDFEGLPEGLRDYDKILAGTLANGPYALGYKLDFSGQASPNGDCRLHPLHIAWLRHPGPVREIPFFQARGLTCNLPALAAEVENSGFLNALPDPDGVLRRAPLLIKYRDDYLPGLVLATLMRAKGLKQILLKVAPHGTESIRFGDVTIPLGEKGTVLVNYRGRAGAYPYLPAWMILENKLPGKALEGMVIFVGTSAPGLKDTWTTPLGAVFPGVEIQATLADNILSSDALVRPDWANGLEIILILAVGLTSALLLCQSRTLLSLLALAIFAVGLWQGSLWALANRRMYFSPLMPLLTIAVNFGFLTLVNYWREQRQKRFLRAAFGHYVSPAVVAELTASAEKLTLSGEEKEVTVLFSDIRGFTGLSESLSPGQVTDLLHAYLTPMTRIITANQGTLDKYMGDAIMAFWNAPLDVPDHPRRALETALAMLAELKKINRSLKEEMGLELKIGIGLHTGLVRVGNMGSEDLFDYTVIGDTVNLASRLESLTKYYGLDLLFSETVVQSCAEEIYCLEVDRVRVRGKSWSAAIFTALEPEAAAGRREKLDRFQAALESYRSRDFAAAKDVFAGLAADFPEQLLYARYLERCADLIASPPPADWDGVFIHS